MFPAYGAGVSHFTLPLSIQYQAACSTARDHSHKSLYFGPSSQEVGGFHPEPDSNFPGLLMLDKGGSPWYRVGHNKETSRGRFILRRYEFDTIRSACGDLRSGVLRENPFSQRP